MTPEGAALYFDFSQSPDDLAGEGRRLAFRGLRWEAGKPLEFTSALQVAEVDLAGMAHLAMLLDGATSMTVGGWFLPRRAGEQAIFSRGLPEVGVNGERFFRPSDRYVNFCLGTDQHGFFMATVHGNARMPFVFVTLNEPRINTWNQLVAVKDAQGYQKFYQNGVLVHADHASTYSPVVRPFRETGEPSEPVRLTLPQGGLIGEAWVYPRELTASEIRDDWQVKQSRYRPAPVPTPVALREMDAHPSSWLWKEPPTAASWPRERERILAALMQLFGPFPKEKVPLEPREHGDTDCGSYVRRKVSIQVQRGDRMPAYVLIPKRLQGRAPALLCFYGTTSGAGKETTVGLSGGRPGSPPEKNRGFAVDFAEAGFVTFAADYLRDGERIEPGMRPYDTTRFYQRFPDWSIHGKDVWDNARAIDYLRTLDFVDGDRIGMVGHSYGGHSTIFAAALEPRIKAAVANGPVSSFWDHGMHWGVPKGGGNSQSLPAMRPYLLDRTWPLPVTFHEVTSLIAPRPLIVGQAVGERRPWEEENHAGVAAVYRALGHAERVRYHWYPGDHDFPPAAVRAAAEWFHRWLDR
jgi:dienelactone hydrolase